MALRRRGHKPLPFVRPDRRRSRETPAPQIAQATRAVDRARWLLVTRVRRLAIVLHLHQGIDG